MTPPPLSATAAAAIALLLAAPLAAQTVGGDPNRDDGASRAEAAATDPGQTVREVMDGMRAGIENPDTAFDGIDSDLDIVVIRLSELRGTEEERAELDAELTESAAEFVEYHRQIAENADVSRGVEETGYTAEDVIALWQGEEQVVIVVNDDSEDG